MQIVATSLPYTVYTMSINMDKILCPFCCATVKNKFDCTCKWSKRNRKDNAKPPSKSVKLLKYLGTCPKCKTVITPNDIDRYLKVVCPICQKTETYENVKAGVWK